MHILECDVRHVRMPSVLQLVEGEMFTGRVTFTPGGFVAVRSGAVVGAETSSGLSGVAAMRELFLVPEGVCRIELDTNVTGAPIDSTIGLILDGCKLLDEWNELAGDRFVIARKDMKVSKPLEAMVRALRAVLVEMRAGATLQEAVTDAGAHRSVVTPQIIALIEAGVLETGALGLEEEAPPEEAIVPVMAEVIESMETSGPPALPQVASPKSATRERPQPRIDVTGVDLDELVMRAREFIRSGQFDEAEQLLRAALERNPNDRVLAQNLRHIALRRQQSA